MVQSKVVGLNVGPSFKSMGKYELTTLFEASDARVVLHAATAT